MTVADLDKRLADMRERSEAATPGPWGTYAAYGSRGVEVADTEDMVFIQDGGITYAAHEADAQFIAHARTDLDDLRGAVEDVLALHQPVVVTEALWRPAGTICSSCDPEDYPCPTVAAITARLGGA